jgi:hypothetical protein
VRARACSPLASLGLLAGVALLTAGCAAALRQPVPGDLASAAQSWPGTTLEDLQRGRTLYVRRCSGCHTLYLPSAYRAGSWPALVESMSEKARLTPAQERDVTRFVVTLAAAPSH